MGRPGGGGSAGSSGSGVAGGVGDGEGPGQLRWYGSSVTNLQIVGGGGEPGEVPVPSALAH